MNKETKIGKMGRMLMLQHMIGAGEGCDGDKHERSQASVNQKSQLLAGKQGHRAEDTQQGSTSCVFSLQSDGNLLQETKDRKNVWGPSKIPYRVVVQRCTSEKRKNFMIPVKG
ncbi:Uncharacterized protein TCM_034605 [Theobroma cacao]|uniref:Uncharacterized protein n=1 Tax=Theobroma cacao TaxID=3641 RepID=A0A061FFU8_THECC|nr:Uncharacterized protein TCM_034605 [Theobroma cacao]